MNRLRSKFSTRTLENISTYSVMVKQGKAGIQTGEEDGKPQAFLPPFVAQRATGAYTMCVQFHRGGLEAFGGSLRVATR